MRFFLKKIHLKISMENLNVNMENLKEKLKIFMYFLKVRSKKIYKKKMYWNFQGYFIFFWIF